MGKKIDMTGWVMKEHGVPQSYLTVIEEDKDYKKNNNKLDSNTYWKCKCNCGKIITAASLYIRKGNITSCGCKRSDLKRAKLENKHFGNLTVLNFSHIDKHHSSIWKCKCECGNITYVNSHMLLSGHTKSCGCKQQEKFIKYAKSLAHDLTGKKFGKLTVIKYLYSSYQRIYLC